MLQTETKVPRKRIVVERNSSVTTSLFDSKSILLAGIVTFIYLAVSYVLIGFRTDQVLLAAICNALYFGSRITRQFIVSFSIFVIYWIIFDFQKAFPNYRYNAVEIESLYNAEKSLLGILWQGKLVTPSEFFELNHTPFLDFISGIFYLCWIPVPLIFAAILFFKNRNFFFQFCLTFVVVNLLGWTGYYSYPAAPPWYVHQYGFNFVADTPGSAAGLLRFDDLVGVKIFEGIYAKSSNVFAAMPSLHAAYVMIVWYYSARMKMKRWVYLYALITIGIWFAAVYSSHHYVLDIIAGIFCAALGIFLFQLFNRTTAGKKLVDKLVAVTTK